MGSTYEKAEILKWLRAHMTDLKTNEKLGSKDMFPTRALNGGI